MAYAPLRSMTAELYTGLADGRYKQIVKDRGGFVDRATYDNRADLHDLYFGIHEKREKYLAPCEEPYATQGYRATPEANPWG